MEDNGIAEGANAFPRRDGTDTTVLPWVADVKSDRTEAIVSFDRWPDVTGMSTRNKQRTSNHAGLETCTLH